MVWLIGGVGKASSELWNPNHKTKKNALPNCPFRNIIPKQMFYNICYFLLIKQERNDSSQSTYSVVRFLNIRMVKEEF